MKKHKQKVNPMSKEYKLQEDSKNIVLLRQITDVLPFCSRGFFTEMLGSRGLSSRTVLGYARDFEVFCFYLKESNPLIKDYQDITPEFLDNLKALDIDEYLAYLSLYKRNGKDWQNSVAGKRRKLSCLKSFWKWAMKHDILHSNPTQFTSGPKEHTKDVIKIDVSEIPDVYQNIESGNTLTEHSRKISAKSKLRDMAIISLMLGTGIRVSECAGIDLSDINFTESSIKIIRKGGNEQKVYFGETVSRHLTGYIESERMDPKDGSGALFVSRNRTRLTVRSIEKIVKKYVDPVVSEDITPHKLRSTFATELYNQSKDLYLIQSALGHKQIQTSTRYTGIDESHRKEVPNFIENLQERQKEE